jgi:hypothetical protein
MKSFVLSLILLLGNISYAAYLPAVQHSELCVFDAGDGIPDLEEKWFEIKFIDVLKVKALSKFHLKLVNNYISGDDDFKGPMTLKEIQKKYRGSDLGIILLNSKKTDRRYIEVRAYPGDNPVGVIYDARDGKVLANNGDGSYSIVTDEGERYCKRY